MNYTDENYVDEILIDRDPKSHKGDFGKVLVFAGSYGMSGAAVLCARAAIRSGAGLVTFLLPEESDPLYLILQTSVPEATITVYKEDMDFSEYNAICAGCGLGTSEERIKILTQIINTYEGVLVLDADALNAIAADGSLENALTQSKSTVILTPHPGEAKRLLKAKDDILSLEERMVAVCAMTEIFQCIAVLKGADTLIAEKDSSSPTGFSMYENTTGNCGMATAGAGDVLTGTIASLAGQGYAPLDAARLGVFMHGKAGDMAAEDIGVIGTSASDLVDYLPIAFKFYYDPGQEL